MKSVILFLTLITVFCIIAGAETQKEKDLKAQLEAAQLAKEAQQTKIGDSIKKLSSDAATRSIRTRQDYAKVAETAALAASNAETAKQAATLAAEKAVAAADRIEAKIEVMQKVSEQGTSNVLITEISGFAVVLVGLLFKAWSDYRDHNWAKASALRTEKMVESHKSELEEVKTIAIDTKTEASKAYDQANNFNTKLKKLSEK